MDAADAELDFMGDITWATVIFGPDDAEPILGVTALESVGIEVDPQNQRLKRLPAVRLKRCWRCPLRLEGRHGADRSARLQGREDGKIQTASRSNNGMLQGWLSP